jgi:hypothetical protein
MNNHGNLTGLDSNHSYRNVRRRPNVTLLTFGSITFFMFGALAVWLFQQLDFVASSEKGMPIPDVVNITQSLDNLFRTVGLGKEYAQFIGLEVIYGWVWNYHPALAFVVNIILMSLAIIIFVQFFIKELQFPTWSVLGLIINPYLILASVGPNKEIPLVAITIVFFVALHRRSLLSISLAALMCFLAYLIRDGHGVFLALMLSATIALRFDSRAVTFALCGVCVAGASFFGLLRDTVPIIARNVDGFEAVDRGFSSVGALAGALNLDQYTIFGGFVLFFLRVIYNLFSLAFFPVLRTTSGFSYLGFSYWLFGLIILTVIIACVLNFNRFRKADNIVNMAIAVSVGALFMISVSLFVQPRYLMPILPMAFAVFSVSEKKVRVLSMVLALGLTFVVVIFNAALGLNPPVSYPTYYDTPAYIL